jgi:hypothetical protein
MSKRVDSKREREGIELGCLDGKKRGANEVQEEDRRHEAGGRHAFVLRLYLPYGEP